MSVFSRGRMRKGRRLSRMQRCHNRLRQPLGRCPSCHADALQEAWSCLLYLSRVWKTLMYGNTDSLFGSQARICSHTTTQLIGCSSSGIAGMQGS